MTARVGDFVFVRCSDLRTAQAVKPSSPPSAVIFDCDGDRLGAYSIKSADDILSAMDDANRKWCDREITWGSWNNEVVAEARQKKKPLVLLFADDRKECEETAKAMEHRAIAKHHDKVALIRLEWTKDSEFAKKWGVYTAPTVLMVDPLKEPGPRAILEQLVGKQKTPSLRQMFLKGLEKAKDIGKE